jgi:hypothetical protein
MSGQLRLRHSRSNRPIDKLNKDDCGMTATICSTCYELEVSIQIVFNPTAFDINEFRLIPTVMGAEDLHNSCCAVAAAE